MSETFLDNQKIFAENLNDIAIDLGVASFCGFTDGTPYATDQLNGITAALVTKGILISGNNCKVVLQNGSLYVQTGIIVFENGAKIKISSPIELEYGAYIYAKNDTELNKISIISSPTQPSSGDFVMLAQVTEYGDITDLRTFAKAKMALNCQNQYQNFSVDLSKATALPVTIEVNPICSYIAYEADNANGGDCMKLLENTEKLFRFSQAAKPVYITKNGAHITFRKPSDIILSTYTFTFM